MTAAEPPAPDLRRLGAAALSADDQSRLLSLARGTIEEALHLRRRPRLDPAMLDPGAVGEALLTPGAAFVTLRGQQGQLLGCIGSLRPSRSLAEDVARHAYDAAFRDPRFPPLDPTRAAGMSVEISVLTPPTPFPAQDYDDLVQRAPRGSGLTIAAAGRRATFLPVVWENLADPAWFVAELWRKAGLPPEAWPPGITIDVYDAQEFTETLQPDPRS